MLEMMLSINAHLPPRMGPECQPDFFQYYGLVEYLARRRFNQEGLAEEAQNHVLESLSVDNWKKLRSYSQKGSFKAYLSQVVLRALEDFARIRFGRVRPPAHVFVQGALWVRLFQLMCLEGYSPREASAIVSQEMPEQHDADVAYTAAKSIRGSVVDCGKKTVEVCLEEDALPANMEDEPLHRMPPDDLLEKARRQALLEALSTLLAEPDEKAKKYTDGDVERYEKMLRSVDISDVKDKLLLRLIYQDGLTLAAAGKVLGLSISQTHAKLHGLLRRIRHILPSGIE